MVVVVAEVVVEVALTVFDGVGVGVVDVVGGWVGVAVIIPPGAKGVLLLWGLKLRLWLTVPPPLVLTQARLRFKEQKCGNTAMFGQAHVTAQHVPRNTCCGHKPPLPLKT